MWGINKTLLKQRVSACMKSNMADMQPVSVGKGPARHVLSFVTLVVCLIKHM